MVVCIWSAPASQAARALARASPMSLWTCTSSGVSTTSRAARTKRAIPRGLITPTVSGRLIRSTPASRMATHTLFMNSGSARLPSSRVNRILRPCDFAYSTVSTALSSASSRVILSLSARWTSDIPRYAAHHSAPQSIDTSMSSLRALPCDTMSACSPSSSMVLVEDLWDGDMIGDISI